MIESKKKPAEFRARKNYYPDFCLLAGRLASGLSCKEGRNRQMAAKQPLARGGWSKKRSSILERENKPQGGEGGGCSWPPKKDFFRGRLLAAKYPRFLH